MSEHLLDRSGSQADTGSTLGKAGFRGSAQTLDGSVLIRLEGELDMATAAKVRHLLNVALDARASTVALDLTQLTFLDSTGVHVLMSARRRAAAQGSSFVVRSPLALFSRFSGCRESTS